MDNHRSIPPPSRRQSAGSTRRLSYAISLQAAERLAMSNERAPAYSSLQQRDVDDSKEIIREHPISRLQRFGWWWEFGAVFVAIVSTAAIIGVLVKVHEQPIASWPWSIQPASLVSIFSTVAKSALLVPVAVCLSQLKWSYFEKPQELGHIQAFDDASRGPWGASVFLWKTKGMAWLAAIGALITVLMTAFEPFSQQAIHFSERSMRIYNETAWIGVTTQLSDARNAYGAIYRPRPEAKLNFTISMMEAFIGRPSVYKSSTSCPSNDCRFRDFTSLGVRSVCEPPEAVQIDNKFGCTYYIASNTTDARQNFTKLQPFKEAVARDTGRNLSTYGMDCSRTKEGFPTFYINMTVDAHDGGYTLKPGSIQTNVTSSFTQPNSDLFGVSEGFFQQSGDTTAINSFGGIVARFCISSFNRLYGGNSATNGTFDTIGAFTCFDRPNYNHNITNLDDNFGQFNATLTHCHLSLCAQEYRNVTVSNNTLGIGSLNEAALQKVGDGSFGEAIAASASNSNKLFTIGPKSLTPTVDLLKTVLYSADFSEFIAVRQNYSDWRAVFVPIASSMSEFIRSPFMNDQAFSNIGQVYSTQVFFYVTWGWVVMPLLLVTLSVGFLVATAVYSRDKTYLFKNSVLAALRYGVQGWDKEVQSVKRETDTDLDRAARGVKARLMNGEVGLRFVKEGS